jgi:hypothetical protein
MTVWRDTMTEPMESATAAPSTRNAASVAATTLHAQSAVPVAISGGVQTVALRATWDNNYSTDHLPAFFSLSRRPGRSKPRSYAFFACVSALS